MPAKPATERATREILDALRRIVRFARVSATTTQGELGVTAAQLFVLHALAEAGSLSVNETAERVHTDQSSVSVVVKRLVAKGFVARRRSEKDARRVELTPTSKGRALAAKDVRTPAEGLLRGLERMSPASRNRLALALGELLAAMGIEDVPASMLFEDGAARTKSAPRRR